MTTHRSSALVLLVSAFVAVSLLACSSSDDAQGGSASTPATDADASNSPGGGGVDLASLCGGDLGPCSLGDVDDSVRELEETYALEVLDRIQSGSYLGALDWVKGQPNVVEADAQEGILMFRLEGGRPFFVVRPMRQAANEVAGQGGFAEGLGVNQGGRDVGAVQIALETPVQRAPAAGPLRVVGEGTRRDNPQNRKKALFLTPYEWQGLSLFNATGPNPIEHLREIPDYNHDPADVGHLTNEQVTPQTFQGWGNYDAIFLETHGGVLRGRTFIATGVVSLFDRQSAQPGDFTRECDRLRAPYASLAGVDCGIVEDRREDENGQEHIDEYIAVGVSPVFFSREYGGGLEAAIIYFGGCYSAADDDVATILAGPGSGYVGWSNLTFMSKETRTAALLVWLLVLHGDGETLGGALEILRQEGMAGGVDFGPNPEGASLGFFPGRNEERKQLRLYSVPTIRDPKSNPGLNEPGLLDGAILKIEGAINDGINDAVEIAVDLFGIVDPDHPSADLEGIDGNIAFQEGGAAGLYNLSFFLDGRDIGRDNLGRHLNPTAAVLELGEGRFRYVFTADLWFDVTEDQEGLPLKVVVDLPEGGQSDYEVNVRLEGREAGAVISVGAKTWEFELVGIFGEPCSVEPDNRKLVAAGFVDGDFSATSFSADLEPGGRDVEGLFSVHGITVKDEETGAEWMADELEFPSLEWLADIPPGGSQIDSITIEDGHAYGTATFYDVEAAHRAWLNKTEPPAPVPGTFDIQCGS
ncbi:MAG: hypothetical protein R3C39_10775 [Dehalococcoidia bacterium]